ncbi:MAG TPA: hypothetical protein VGH87_02055 [Polyangiaceae bacterium]
MRAFFALPLLTACSLTDLSDLRVDASTADADAASLGFCASLTTPAALCADFDEDASVDAGFTSVVATVGAGTVAFDPAASFSSPRSARTSLAANTPGAPQAYLQYDVTGAPTIVHVEAEIDPLTLSPSKLVDVLDVSQSNVRLRLYMTTTQTVAQEEQLPAYTDYYGMPAPDFGHWHRLAIDLTLGASAKVVISEDGLPIVQKQLVYPWSKAPVSIAFGVYADNSANEALAVDYDDVLVTAQ